jgi:hypothetical protein
MKTLTKTLIKTLLTLLLIWVLPALAQETADATTDSTDTTESAYNWVNLPDQNPLKRPTITGGFGTFPHSSTLTVIGTLMRLMAYTTLKILALPKNPSLKHHRRKSPKNFLAVPKSTAILDSLISITIMIGMFLSPQSKRVFPSNIMKIPARKMRRCMKNAPVPLIHWRVCK